MNIVAYPLSFVAENRVWRSGDLAHLEAEYLGVRKVRARFSDTYFAGLHIAGMSEMKLLARALPLRSLLTWSPFGSERRCEKLEVRFFIRNNPNGKCYVG
jgi:hypothetical protein